MEFKVSTIAAIFAMCMIAVQALTQPMLGHDEVNEDLSAEKRPKYLETRTLEDFKNAMLLALDELISEGKINPDVLQVSVVNEKPKRGRYMGFCLKKTRSGAIIPELCWKGEGSK